MAKVFTITEGLQNMGALKTGGQGSVYKAKRMGEIITAVKLLPTPIHSESEQDKNFISFQNEVRKLEKVNAQPNPNVVKMLSYGITDSGSFPFIEMEFIEGPDLEDLLKHPHDPVFTIKETIKLAEQLSHALEHCHKQDVKHGDIKSNNVKFNRYTGNYVLLDFGLSAMSDEQRRTSLRHAGAIEFMAPEQNNGQLLFETDIYGFGVILFELLAGQVPFPLRDGSESARNTVMLSHMETQPPDLKELRRNNLPGSWDEQKKEKEMQVPEWLLSLIYRCLRKKPEERFANGTELHQFIAAHSVGIERIITEGSGRNDAAGWQYQAEKLLKEKQELQRQLSARDAEISRLKQNGTKGERYPGQDDFRGNSKRNTAWIVAFIITLLVASGLAYALIASQAGNESNGEEQTENTQNNKAKNPIGYYKVQAARSYFHNEPDASTSRKAFVLKDASITAFDQENSFVYTEFTNSRGQVSKGWLPLSDLLPLDEWQRRKDSMDKLPSEANIKRQLAQAAGLLQEGRVEESIAIYDNLVDLQVPEAMYQLSELGLKGQHPEMECSEAQALLQQASDLNYLPAKRTRGLLYLFAENEAWLEINNYNNCTYQKNMPKARQLLTEAANGGDSTAAQILNELNLSYPPEDE